MTRTLVALGLLSVAASGRAQNVVVRPQPGAGCWTVSHTRIHDKTNAAAELDGSFKTLAAAQAEAARLKRWSDSMQPGSGWRLQTIFIEGEDAASDKPPAGDKEPSPKVPGFWQAVADHASRGKELLDRLTDLKEIVEDPDAALARKGKEAQDKLKEYTGLRDYMKNVEGAYARAKEAKDKLLGQEASLTADSFAKVNALVKAYNDAAAGLPGGASGLLPSMTPAGPETAGQVREWRAALAKQFELEGRKEALDARKAALDAERESLAAEWKSLAAGGEPDPADPRVVRLRERLDRYEADAAAYQTSLAEYKAQAAKLRERAAKLNSDARAEVAVATPQERPFVGTWRKGSARYTFLPGGKGRIKYDRDDRESTFTWTYHGISTVTRVPTSGGGRDGSWQGRTIRWWFGESDPGLEKSYRLAAYTLDGRQILVPSPNFYDGRDWYSRED